MARVVCGAVARADLRLRLLSLSPLLGGRGGVCVAVAIMCRGASETDVFSLMPCVSVGRDELLVLVRLFFLPNGHNGIVTKEGPVDFLGASRKVAEPECAA